MEKLAERTSQWGELHESPAKAAPTGSNQPNKNVNATEAKFAVIMSKIEAIEANGATSRVNQVNQITSPSLFNGQWNDHFHAANNSWNQGTCQGGPVANANYQVGPQFLWSNIGKLPSQNTFVNPQTISPPFNPFFSTQFSSNPSISPLVFGNDQKLNSLKKSMTSLTQSVQTMVQNFAKIQEMCNTNNQAIVQLKMELGQMANHMAKKEKGRSQNQSVAIQELNPLQPSQTNDQV